MSGAHGEDSIDRAVAAGGTPQAPSSSAGVQSGADVRPTGAQVWLARGAFAAASAAVVLLVFAGPRSLPMVLVGAAGVAAFVAGSYWFLAKRGVLRWAATALAVVAPLVVLGLYVRAGLLWVAGVSVGLLALAVAAGGAALAVEEDGGMATYDAPRPRARSW